MKLLTKILCVLVVSASGAGAQTDVLPQRVSNNVVVAVYNIQFFGEKQHDLSKLATVIQHFDVCGILEVKGEQTIRELAQELEALTGQRWGYTYGVRTHRPSGRYHEAYAAVWRKDRVELGGGVVGGIWDLEEAFRNDPYLVSFRAGNYDFTLFLLHTRWTDDSEGNRENEVAMLAEQILWMRGFLPERDFILAGDFNYPGTHSNMVNMADRAELIQIDKEEKSTFRNDGSGYASPYDHMYISATDTPEYIPESCKVLDTTQLIYNSKVPDIMKKSRSELSDHLPVFAVFKTDMVDDD